ncbi:50S ribosome-binding GTPase [Streptomyces sp. LX-29]|uniref:GTPase n=1 Tax=Streptomyces sp. LX-29 TaxID=2900152 RepID=UPI00240D006A|nr:GTPase [Streptomyces sp. LX-29]WFB09659.1 50S ribosome-binding GTPase [Streptomyces sp. LX-29]
MDAACAPPGEPREADEGGEGAEGGAGGEGDPSGRAEPDDDRKPGGRDARYTSAEHARLAPADHPQLALAERVALLADRAGADGAAALIRRAGRRAGTPLARVCVVGSTNAGKSQLVNRLAGAARVPVSALPVARPPTVVRSEGGDDWLARSGLELVDTPGWDLTAEAPAHWADGGEPARVVADSDVVVVATEARRALLGTEQARIRGLAGQPHAPAIVVVVTKLDEVEDERDEVMRRVRHLIRTLAPEAHLLPGPLPERAPDASPADRSSTAGSPTGGDREDGDRENRGRESGASRPTRDDEHLELCRSALTALTGARQRIALRTVRRLRLLADACELVAGAAERGPADARRDTERQTRALEVWHAAHESARFGWIVLGSELDRRRAALIGRVRAEAGLRRARCAAELSATLSEAPDLPAFLRLRALPRIELALEEFEGWIVGAVEAALAEDTGWLRERLAAGRPGEHLFAELTPAPPATPYEAPAPPRSGAGGGAFEGAAAWLPEAVGGTVEQALAPVASEAIAAVLGAVATGLVEGALARGQERRLLDTVDQVDHAVDTAFEEHLAAVERRVAGLYERLEAGARDRDEQWWRLHTAALAAPPASREHWRSLRDEAARLRREVETHMSALGVEMPRPGGSS